MRRRLQCGLEMIFIADSLSMPVHWFYNPNDILKYFPGGIKKFEDAPNYHPSSIMNLHSTSSGGRGSQHSDKQIIGDVILKGKRSFWGKKNFHYHHGMKAGDNTLNACCALLLMKQLQNSEYNSLEFLKEYEEFMTSEVPKHNDTYAESYHREFFANRVKGKPLDKCAGITHDTPSIGAFVTIAPLALINIYRQMSLEQVKKICKIHLYLTHPDKGLGIVCDYYVELLYRLVNLKSDNIEDVKVIILDISRKTVGNKFVNLLLSNSNVSDLSYSTACYISGSWPIILFIAFKYCENPLQGLLVNTNIGGENCHRGSVLGSILGVANPINVTDWLEQLHYYDKINTLITSICSNN